MKFKKKVKKKNDEGRMCECCRHFVPWFDSQGKRKSTDSGDCRKNPPVIVRATEGPDSLFPWVSPTACCGEHKFEWEK